MAIDLKILFVPVFFYPKIAGNDTTMKGDFQNGTATDFSKKDEGNILRDSVMYRHDYSYFDYGISSSQMGEKVFYTINSSFVSCFY